MRNLHHNSGTVARLWVGSLCAAVHHVFEHLKTLFHKSMTLNSLNVDKQANAAGIFLILRAV